MGTIGSNSSNPLYPVPTTAPAATTLPPAESSQTASAEILESGNPSAGPAGSGTSETAAAPPDLKISKALAESLNSSEVQLLIDGILADGTVDKLDDTKLKQLNILLDVAAKKNDGQVDATEDSILDALDSRGMFGTNKEVVKSNLQSLSKKHNAEANALDFSGNIKLVTQDGVSGFFGGKQERALRLDVFETEPLTTSPSESPTTVSQSEEPSAPPVVSSPEGDFSENNKQIKADARSLYAEGVNNELATAEQQFVSEIKKVQSAINAMPSDAVIKELQGLVGNSSEEGVDLPYILEMSQKIGIEPSALVSAKVLPAEALENKNYKPSAQEINALKSFYSEFPFNENHVKAYKDTINDLITFSVRDNKIVPEKYQELKDGVYNKNYLFEATGTATAESKAQYQNLKTAMNAYESTKDFAETANRDSAFLTGNAKATNSNLNYYDQRSEKTLVTMSESILDMVGGMESNSETEAVMKDLKQVLVLDSQGNISRDDSGKPMIRKPLSKEQLNQVNALWNSLEQLGISSGLDADPGDLTEAFFKDLATTDPAALQRMMNEPTVKMLQQQPQLANHAELFKQLDLPGNEALKEAVLSGDTSQVETLLQKHQSALTQSYMSWFSFLPGVTPASEVEPDQLLNLGSQSSSDIRALAGLLSGNSPEADTLRTLAAASGNKIQQVLESSGFEALQQKLTEKEKFDTVFWGANSEMDQAKSSLTANLKKRTQIASDLEVVKQHLIKAADTATGPSQDYLKAQIESVTRAQSAIESGEPLPEGKELNQMLSIVSDGGNIEQSLQGMAAVELFRKDQASKLNPELIQQIMAHLKPEDQATLKVLMLNQPLLEKIMSGTVKYGEGPTEIQGLAASFGALLEEASRLNDAGDSEGIQKLFAKPIASAGNQSPSDMAKDMAFLVNQINDMGLQDSQSIEMIGATSLELLRRSKADASKSGKDPYALFNESRNGIASLVNTVSTDAFISKTSDFLKTASNIDQAAIGKIISAHGIQPLSHELGDPAKTLARISSESPDVFQHIVNDVNRRATGTGSTEFWRTLDSEIMAFDSSLIINQQRVELAETVGEISTDLGVFFTQNQQKLSSMGITREKVQESIFSDHPDPTARAALLKAFPELGKPENHRLLVDLLNLNRESTQVTSDVITVQSIVSGKATNAEISAYVLNQLVTDVETKGLDPNTSLQESDKPRLEGIKQLRDSLLAGGLDLNKPEDKANVKTQLKRLGIPENIIDLWVQRLDGEFSIQSDRRNRAHNTLEHERQSGGGGGSFTALLADKGAQLINDLAATGASLEKGVTIKTTPEGFLDRTEIEEQAPEEIEAREALYENNPPAFFQQVANVSRQEQLDIVYNAAFEAIETGDRTRFEGLARSLQTSDNRVAQRSAETREAMGLSGSSAVNPTRSTSGASGVGGQAGAADQKSAELVAQANALAEQLVLAPKGAESEELLSDLVTDFLNIIRDQDYKTRQLVLAQLANQMMTDSITNFYKDKTDKNNKYHQDALSRMAASFEQNIQKSIQSSLVASASGRDAQSVAAVSGQVGAAGTAEAMSVAQLRSNTEELLSQAQQVNPPLMSDDQKEHILNRLFDQNPSNDALGIIALAGLQPVN